MKPENHRINLEHKTNDELRSLVKKLELTGYSSLKKSELVEHILKTDSKKLESTIYPSWWSNYHNHVYGLATVIALALSITFYFAPVTDNDDPYLNGSRRIVNIIEKPIGFIDYTDMNQLDRTDVFKLHLGEEVTWEGYIVSFSGFIPGFMSALPFETQIGIRLAPRETPIRKTVAHFEFEPAIPTDSGYKFMSQISGLRKGQRLRLTGYLGGSPQNPNLTYSELNTIFPLHE